MTRAKIASKAKSAFPQTSGQLLRLFATYSRHYLRRNFHTIRLAVDSHLPKADETRPIVVYVNHASWWDPLVCLYLARRFFRERVSVAPIEAAMLKRYAFFKRLGFYPVDSGTTRGALKFLRTTTDLMQSDSHMLWLTPQGRFADPRERPIPFRRGLGALATRLERALFVPAVIDYTFWTEPQPEILISFGRGVVPEQELTNSISDWTNFFAHTLEQQQDHLARKAMRREASDWIVLERGASGVNSIFDGWRSLKSRVRGVSFSPEHQPDGEEQ